MVYASLVVIFNFILSNFKMVFFNNVDFKRDKQCICTCQLHSIRFLSYYSACVLVSKLVLLFFI